jgi:hypothetical protein
MRGNNVSRTDVRVVNHNLAVSRCDREQRANQGLRSAQLTSLAVALARTT